MQIDSKVLKTDEKVAYALRSLYRRFGYCQYHMSKFEEYSLYARNKDFLVSDAIISFTDTSGRLLALKPDVTLSIINNTKDAAGHVHKMYYDENVYRLPKGSHSFKEIKQTGLECIGDIKFLEICEVILLALRSLEAISEKYIFEISHIGLMEALFAEINLEDSTKKRILSCISSKNTDELNLICSEINISDDKKDKLAAFMKNYASFDEAIASFTKVCHSTESLEKLDEFRKTLEFITKTGFSENTKINFSLTNDMNYYSGIAFRGYIQGIPTSILSGGQYDNLMRRMGRNANAIGFAVYLDALKRLNYNDNDKDYDVDIILLAGDDTAAAIKAAETLSFDGTSVRICHKIPKGIRYRQILSIADKGATENNGND